MSPHTALWTLDELTARVALALAEGYGGQMDRRVRDVPDVRTIRYYTTLGLLDRPAGMRGRTALYGLRHLLQLVAVKRLQARGLTLAQVQERLVGRSDAALHELAGVSLELLAANGVPADSPAQRREGFWKETPEPVANPPPSVLTQTLAGVSLAEEVSLLLWNAARPPDAQDVEALRAAAAPLLKLLAARRLVGRPQEKPHTEGESP
jgi:DNA-binding transcriptional MerR regulator